MHTEFSMIEEAAESVRQAFDDVPPILVVAGSGLGGFAKTLAGAHSVSYGGLKNFPVSNVVGHAGSLVHGTCAGVPVVVMSGRKHLYEGVSPEFAVRPLRALIRCGVKTVILSNAAGGLNHQFAVGDLMLITDHINNQYRNPLIGANIDELGPRFPDMSEPYDRALGQIARDAARELGITLREGVYTANLGPTYETRAEVGMLRLMADAVGMSTAPETIAAVHAGVRVLGISLITNSLVQETVTTHEEVMETGRHAGERFNKLVTAVIQKL